MTKQRLRRSTHRTASNESQGFAKCARCGVLCRKRPGSGRAKLLKYTAADAGVCVNCGVTAFLRTLGIIASPRRGDPPFDPEDLLLPHVQQQFSAVMLAGNSDAKPDQIDWLKVVANWSLPFGQKS